MRCSAASRRAIVSASERVSVPLNMGFLARMKRRWHTVRHIANEANQIEQHFPYAALTGIGFNAVWWAAIEHQLDMLVFWHSYTRLGDERDEHPRSLSNKLRYMKSIERDKSIVDADRVEIRRLRLQIAEIAERRHDFTHSFMDIADPTADWPFSRFRYEGKDIRLVRRTYDIEQLSALSADIHALVGDFSPLVERLALPWLKINASLFTNSSMEKPRP